MLRKGGYTVTQSTRTWGERLISGNTARRISLIRSLDAKVRIPHVPGRTTVHGSSEVHNYIGCVLYDV